MPRADVILIGYLMKYQMIIMSRSAKYIIRSRSGIMAPRIIIMLQSDIYFRIHLESISTISLLGNFSGKVGGFGGEGAGIKQNKQ